MKRTFQPSKLVRKRRHGYRARMATTGGRKVIAARARARPQAVVGLMGRRRGPAIGSARLRDGFEAGES